MINIISHTNLFSWRAGSQAHFPRLGGRKKNKNKNSMIFSRLPLLYRWNLKAYGGIIL
jgi:hypothetical protein